MFGKSVAPERARVRTTATLLVMAFLASSVPAPVGLALSELDPVQGTMALAPDAMEEARKSTTRVGERLGVLGDSPGDPYGALDHNTYGFTTEDKTMDRWIYDTETETSNAVLDVDMGKLNRKDKISKGRDYYVLAIMPKENAPWLTGTYWTDGDGVYDPADNPNDKPYKGAPGDDGCPWDPKNPQPFKLFTIYVNDEEVRTFEGERMTNCVPGDPEGPVRTFYLKRPDDPKDYWNWVRVPEDVIKEGKNKVGIKVHDQVIVSSMKTNPYHSERYDGWLLKLDYIAMELVAPPFVYNHGWTTGEDADFGAAHGTDLHDLIKSEMKEHFKQDPWWWAEDQGPLSDPVVFHQYNNKQDPRISAGSLANTVMLLYNRVGYDGKGWLHGHSMGGIVSRYYVEKLSGWLNIEKIGQDATPNQGAYGADLYTFLRWPNYEARDGELTADWIYCPPRLTYTPTRGIGGVDITIKCFTGWRDWWSSTIGAYQYVDGPGIGYDRLADFFLKPQSRNPLLADLNANACMPLVQYFIVQGHLTGVGTVLFPFMDGGDSVVSGDSGAMDGRLDTRIIESGFFNAIREVASFHESLMSHPYTGRWLARYYAGLDLDTGKPIDDAAKYRCTGRSDVSDAGASASASVEFLSDGAKTLADFLPVWVPPTLNTTIWAERRFTVDAVPVARFVLHTQDPLDLDVHLVSPTGTEYDQDAPFDGPVKYYEGRDIIGWGRRFDVKDAQAGEWTLRVRPRANLPANGIAMAFSAALESPLAFEAGSDTTEARPGDAVTIAARLTNAGAPLAGATVTATYHTPALEERVLTLRDNGLDGDALASDGVYSGVWTAPDEPHIAAFDVVATGQVAGGAFRRWAVVQVATEVPRPDVAVTQVEGVPASSWGGDPATVRVTVKNVGEAVARAPLVVKVLESGATSGNAILGTATSAVDLASGEARAIDVPITVPARRLTVTAEVVPVDREPLWDNNRLDATMPFVPLPRTLARVAGERDPSGAADTFVSGATFTLGPHDGTAPRYAATYYSLDNAAPVRYTGPVEVRANGVHALRYWSTAADGSVEPARHAAFRVRMPDLALSGFEGGPAGIFGGEAGFLRVALENVGVRAAAGPVRVTFYDGNPATGAPRLGEVALPAGLGSGERVTAEIAVVAPSRPLVVYVVATSADHDVTLANQRLVGAPPFVPLPYTAAALGGTLGLAGWWRGPVSVTLAPYDGSAPRYATTAYTVDGGGPNVYSGTFTVAAEGSRTVRFWSTSPAGDVERTRSVAFRLDTAAPAVNVLTPTRGAIHAEGVERENPEGFTAVAGTVHVGIDASDTGSGVARVRVLVDGIEVGDAAVGADGLYHYPWDSGSVAVGNHVIRVVTDDVSGWTTERDVPVYVLASRAVTVPKDPNTIVPRLAPPGVPAG